jgi:hypothetical protein
VLDKIVESSEKYLEKKLVFRKVFTILYATMIAEENKAYSKLGKRIKRLGVHSILVEEMEVAQAANFMRGMGWRKIDELCRARGF